MTDFEQHIYDSVVHRLRSQGWPRVEAEGKALDRIENMRQRDASRAK